MGLVLNRLLQPRSVAIIGASDKPGALGASLLANLERQGYDGAIHLVNPKRAQIGGRPCVATVDDLPHGIDAAVLAVPQSAVLDTVRALARRGVGAAIIFSAGFAENGAEGLAQQQEITRIATEAGMVLEGPNCLGFVNFVDGIPLTFIELPAERLGDRPGVGIVSQSGAMAAVLEVTMMARGIGLSYSISTGNEAGSGVEDYVDYLIDDPATRLVVMIVEQFRKPRRFLAAAERARAAGKPIVVLHPGRSSAARESAATHTGALAGDYRLMIAKVERAGVIVVETLEELADVSELLLHSPTMGTGGTAVVCESGAYKALTLDLAERESLTLADLNDDNSPALRAAIPGFIGVSNPLDVTAQALIDPDLYARVLAALLVEDRVASILFAIIQTDAVTARIKFPTIVAAIETARIAKPVIVAGLDEGAVVPAEYVAAFRRLGIPYFPTSERVVRALARIEAHRDRDYSRSQDAPLPAGVLPAGVVPEHRAKAILGPLGIQFPKAVLATTQEEADAVAEMLGYPVVLKAQSPDLSHKSDAGGVIVGLAGKVDLHEGWCRLQSNIARHCPGLGLDGVLVEAMGRPGLELIVGARNDPEWGALILVGLGGVQAEIFQDVRLLPADLSHDGIVAELGRLRSAALLHGFRGSPALDIAAVATLIVTLGRILLAEPSIREIDLNPVVVYPAGEGVVALDALMLVAP